MDEIKKELAIRTRISAVYSKQRDDFPSKREYDDYLEMVEDIIYNLAHNIDVIETEQRVREYEMTNRNRQGDGAEASGRAYQPGALQSAAGGAMAAQPVPLEAVQQTAEGQLLSRGVKMDRERLALAAQASGWTPDIPKRRALEAAFTTIFAY